MTLEVFEPLKIENSTFVLSEKPNLQLTQNYKDDCATRQPNKFTALAAASLYNCTADLSKFLVANVSSNGILSEETSRDMSTPETFINDCPVYGLGPHLYSKKDKYSNIIGHDGSGNNAINTAAIIDLISKNGIIILETGNYNMASSLADEWIFWKAGFAVYVVIQRNKSYLLTLLIIGYVIIIILSIFTIKKRTIPSKN